MAEQQKHISFVWLYAIIVIVALILAGIGSHFIYSGEADHSLNRTAVGWGLLGTAALLIAAQLIALPVILSIDAARKAIQAHQDEVLAGFNEQLQQVCLLLNLVNENQLISEKTKSVAFREKDRDTVRRAVQEEIARQDWEAALVLANEMETVFGYKAEADGFRTQITAKRSEVSQRQIAEQMAPVERYINAEAWGQALQEAHRVMTLFPNDERISQLPQEIENRRAARKKALHDSWLEAVKNHDVDGSIEILKHLDNYLTPAEAESMQEMARGVFKEKIVLLRSQFRVAVQEHRWTEALHLGESIMTDFPNSRMAQEVGPMIDMLRQRAADGDVAKV
jgi:hypothetical protein